MSNPAKPSTPKKSRYAGSRRPATIVLSDELVLLAQEYFPHTRHGSLSGFVESTVGGELRKKAKRIRELGLKVPASLFAK